VSIGCLVVLVGVGCADDGDDPDTPDILDPSDDDDVGANGDDGGSDDVAIGTFPTRAPEVTGRVVVDDGAVHLAEESDSYYAGMVLLARDGDDDVLVVDEGGEALSRDDIAEGMAVDVWVGDACAESYPVQCDIEALRIDLAS
jgi:hypothetical protein